MNEEEYRAFRRRAVTAIARSVVRDPPLDGPGDSASGGPDRDGADGDGGAAGDAAPEGPAVVSLAPAVRAYLESTFDDAFGAVDPRELADVVPVEPPNVDTSASTPLSADAEGTIDRERLLAYRTVRADLLSELADHTEEFATAIEVHEALERLVGERGPPTDRRPTDVVSSFLSWIADERGEGTAEALRDEFTVLHVVRVAPLYSARDDGSHELAVALREWLADAHPDALGSRSVSVER